MRVSSNELFSTLKIQNLPSCDWSLDLVHKKVVLYNFLNILMIANAQDHCYHNGYLVKIPKIHMPVYKQCEWHDTIPTTPIMDMWHMWIWGATSAHHWCMWQSYDHKDNGEKSWIYKSNSAKNTGFRVTCASQTSSVSMKIWSTTRSCRLQDRSRRTHILYTIQTEGRGIIGHTRLVWNGRSCPARGLDCCQHIHHTKPLPFLLLSFHDDEEPRMSGPLHHCHRPRRHRSWEPLQLLLVVPRRFLEGKVQLVELIFFFVVEDCRHLGRLGTCGPGLAREPGLRWLLTSQHDCHRRAMFGIAL